MTLTSKALLQINGHMKNFNYLKFLVRQSKGDKYSDREIIFEIFVATCHYYAK